MGIAVSIPPHPYMPTRHTASESLFALRLTTLVLAGRSLTLLGSQAADNPLACHQSLVALHLLRSDYFPRQSWLLRYSRSYPFSVCVLFHIFAGILTSD